MILADFFLTRQTTSMKNPATKDCQSITCWKQGRLTEKYEITMLTDDTIKMH